MFQVWESDHHHPGGPMKITHRIMQLGPQEAGRVLVGSKNPITQTSDTEVILFTGTMQSEDEIVLEGSLEEIKEALTEALSVISSLEEHGRSGMQGDQGSRENM